MQPETPSKAKGLSGAEVAKSAELVDYQDGSIASREIVKNPTANVTIFAFVEGQGVLGSSLERGSPCVSDTGGSVALS